MSSCVRKEFIKMRGTSVWYLTLQVLIVIEVTELPDSYFLLRCSRCCTVRSREVRLSLRGMVEVGPEQPRGVAREPLSLTTTSLSSISLISTGSEQEERSE